MAKEKKSIGEVGRMVETRVKLMNDAIQRYYLGEHGVPSLESALFHLENAQVVIRRLKREIVAFIPAVQVVDRLKYEELTKK